MKRANVPPVQATLRPPIPQCVAAPAVLFIADECVLARHLEALPLRDALLLGDALLLPGCSAAPLVSSLNMKCLSRVSLAELN